MSSTIIVALETIFGSRHLIFTMNLCLCNRHFKRGQVIFLRPCGDRIHLKCWDTYAEGEDGMPCPYCGEVVSQKENLNRKVYKKHSLEDRRRILKAAREETGWLEMANTLGIHRNTAEAWVRQDSESPRQRGALRPKMMTPQVEDSLLQWLEEDCQLTQKQLKEKVRDTFAINISETTIARSLHLKAFTIKKTHAEPESMNLLTYKIKRRDYVEALQLLMEGSGDVPRKNYYIFFLN